jgi:hypothetical protein
VVAGCKNAGMNAFEPPSLKDEIAAAAAAMVVEEGLEYGLAALRELALVWMQRMAAFRPFLGGAVWRGTTTRLSDIYIQLFCDDPKSAEIALIEHQVDYEPRTVTGFTGDSVEALSVRSLCKPLHETVGVHLMVYDHDDLRGALRPDAKGRSPRGDLAAVARLLADS